MRLFCIRWTLLGVFSLMTAAHAQSSTTVYGVLDVTVESARAGPASAARVASNSSLLGFRGTESVGQGWHAIWQIEGGLNADSGSGTLNTRDTFVGLAGPLGTVKLGLFSAPMRAMGGKLSFVPGGSSVANNLGLFTTLGGVQTNLNSRLPNAIQYTSPAFHDVTLSLIHAPGEGRPARDDHAWGTGLAWSTGPHYLGYAYEERHGQQRFALGASRDWEHRLAGRFGTGTLSFGLAWDRLGSDGLYSGGSGSVRRDAWQISFMAVRGMHDLMVHFTVNSDLKCRGGATSGPCAPAAAAASGAKMLSLMYHYAFSKRTSIQAFVSRINNEARALYDVDVNPVVANATERTPGADPTVFALGIRHQF